MNNVAQDIFIKNIIDLASQKDNIVIDGFCGGGGVTEGFSRHPDFYVIAAINHSPAAIAIHKANHPQCLHLMEDFRTADLSIVVYMIAEIKKRTPNVRVHFWISLECTNFSIAKGGQSRDADSRTLADDVDRYVKVLNPDKIWVENVKEFKLWGPMIPKVLYGIGKKKQKIVVPKNVNEIDYFNLLISNNKYPYCPLIKVKEPASLCAWMVPDPDRLSEDYNRWVEYIKSFGYQCATQLLNAADYGVPQHRIRLIMQFTRTGTASTYPIPTHDKLGRKGLPKWQAVKGCLDLKDEGDSVLSFKKKKGKLVPRITSEATIDRLIKGCVKHVLSGNEKNFFTQSYSGDPASKTPGINQPSRAITASGGNLFITKAHCIDYYFGKNVSSKPVTVNADCITAREGAALHSFQFLGTYHSKGDGSAILNPSPAVLANDKAPLITTTHFMDMQYSSGQQEKSIHEVAGAVTNVPKQKLVSADRFIMDTQFNHVGHSIEEHARTVTANRKHYYLVNFQWFNEGMKTIEQPSNTVIARQDKAPSYLVVLETGELAIEIYENDPPHYRKLKNFMAANGIIEIKMRMLKDRELLLIQSMPADYKLTKSATANKKMIGNAVPSDLVTALAEEDSKSVRHRLKKVA